MLIADFVSDLTDLARDYGLPSAITFNSAEGAVCWVEIAQYYVSVHERGDAPTYRGWVCVKHRDTVLDHGHFATPTLVFETILDHMTAPATA